MLVFTVFSKIDISVADLVRGTLGSSVSLECPIVISNVIKGTRKMIRGLAPLTVI